METETIIRSWDLWCEYVDPSATMTEAEFDAMTLEERRAFVVGCFGEEVED